MTAPGDSQSGITLVETLIAIFLVALMATSGGVMLIQSIRGARMVDAKGQDARQLQSALALLRDDFAAFADRPSRTDGTQGPALRFEGHAVRFDGQILTFVRNGWTNPDQTSLRGDLQRVQYRFEQGSLIRKSWASPDAGPGTPSSEQHLLSGIEDVSVRYGRAQVWKDGWSVAAANREDPLPDKVELTIRFSDEDVLTARFRLGLRQ